MLRPPLKPLPLAGNDETVVQHSRKSWSAASLVCRAPAVQSGEKNMRSSQAERGRKGRPRCCEMGVEPLEVVQTRSTILGTKSIFLVSSHSQLNLAV